MGLQGPNSIILLVFGAYNPYYLGPWILRVKVMQHCGTREVEITKAMSRARGAGHYFVCQHKKLYSPP